MTIRFNDVSPGHWAYDDIMEACNTLLEDGEPLMKPLFYQAFEPNKPYIYQEVKAGKNQLTYILNRKIQPSNDNPLHVFVNGVQWAYKSAQIVKEQTHVTLYTAPKEGSIVSFCSYGKPLLGEDGRPVIKTEPYYPHYKLKYYDKYVFWPYYGNYEVVTIFGRRLQRVDIDPEELELAGKVPEFDQELARKYIGDRTDVYIITPSGRLHLPWNFEGMTGKITYAYNTKGKNAPLTDANVTTYTEEFKAYTHSATDTKYEPYRNDRFFPDVWVSREEMITALNRLRIHFITRFTDRNAPGTELNQRIRAYQGQKVFRLNGSYPAGKGLIIVSKRTIKDNPDSPYIILKKGVDYEEFDNHTILLKQPAEEGYYYGFYYKKRVSDRFKDVGMDVKYWNNDDKKLISVNGTTDEWVEHALALEDEKLNDGTYLIKGTEINYWYDASKKIPVMNRYNQPIPGKDSVKKIFLLPKARISRYEVVSTLNRFRKWCLERLI
jgi:hypothetical protein